MERGKTTGEGQNWDLKAGLSKEPGGPGGGSGDVSRSCPGLGSWSLWPYLGWWCVWPVEECLGPEWPNVDAVPVAMKKY